MSAVRGPRLEVEEVGLAREWRPGRVTEPAQCTGSRSPRPLDLLRVPVIVFQTLDIVFF
jgi:hypothetical protein